jgi:hypothetical protein
MTLLLPSASDAQRAGKENERLTYRFEKPTYTPLQHAKVGLPVLDGEIVEVRRSTVTTAEIIGRVRESTWLRNPEVIGSVPGSDAGERVTFGRLQTYLRGDRRFRVLAIPASCRGCEGDRLISILPYADTTGYLVGGAKPGS